jgi:hypothetical protein
MTKKINIFRVSPGIVLEMATQPLAPTLSLPDGARGKNGVVRAVEILFRFTLLLLTVVLFIAAHAASAQETNAPAPTNQVAADTSMATDWNSFKILYQRNIFNPNRNPRRAKETPRPRAPHYDSFTLVGTMSYEKGSFAFFDGSSSEYRKTLKLSDTIAGYRIAKITADSVSLAGASNQLLRLPVGVQIKRPEGGRWAVAGLADASDNPDSASASGSSDSPPAAPADAAPASSAESDIIKRMLARRLSEK